MKQKLLALGMLILSILYWIEVVDLHDPSYEWYQLVGLAITVLTLLPWLIATLLEARKKGKAKAEKEAYKQFKESRKEKS